MASENEKIINQKQGVINKCPSCGGQLKAFASRCDLCGHELAGVGANRTVSDIVQRFNDIENELARAGITGSKLEKELVARKARVIRDFPIPNAREDLLSLIYFIQPKIQENLKPDPNVEDWRVKFKEVMNLAKNAYKGDAKTREEFEKIEQSLKVNLGGKVTTSVRRSPWIAAAVALVAVLAGAGIVNEQMDKRKLVQCEEQYAQGAAGEKARLDALVLAAKEKQKDKKYADALGVANGLHWEYAASCKAEAAAQEKQRWEEKRKELVAAIQKDESDEQAQQRAEVKRVEDEKRAAEEREAAGKLETKAQEMATLRRTSVSKEW